MKVEEHIPISPARLKRMRWRGHQAYRLLSYPFFVRWNSRLLGDRLDYVLGGFRLPSGLPSRPRLPTSDVVPIYSLIDLGPRYRRRYRVMLGDEEVMSCVRLADALSHALWRIVSKVEQMSEVLLIHSGSIVTPAGEGILLPAGSGSGKTTLVAGLIRAGFGFLSDEVGVIDPVTGMLQPYPRAMNFKGASLSLFPGTPLDDGDSPWGSHRYLRAEELRPGAMASPSHIGFIIEPQYRENADTEVIPLSPATSLELLWANSINLRLHGVRAFTRLCDVVRQAYGYRLVSGDLARAVEAVAEITRRRPSRS
jgi:hypothetical protein